MVHLPPGACGVQLQQPCGCSMRSATVPGRLLRSRHSKTSISSRRCSRQGLPAPHTPQHHAARRGPTAAAAAPAAAGGVGGSTAQEQQRASSSSSSGSSSSSSSSALPEGFDLPLGIALAATAFEAYLEPVGAARELQEVTLNATRVTYTDKAFVQAHYEGLLQLTIHGASGLKPVNITGGSDPYAVATLGDSAATTGVQWGQLNPQWGETHTLYVPKAAGGSSGGGGPVLLKLRVLDKNKLVSDVDLGVVMTSLGPLLEAPGEKVTLPLRGANGQGALTVSARLLPFSERLMDGIVADEGKKAPDAPAEVSQISSQLEVALAMQDGLSTRVQAVAAEVQKKVGWGAGQQPTKEVAAAAAAVAAAAASGVQATAASTAAAADGASPAQLGEVVAAAKQQAVKTLSSAMDSLQGALAQSGLKAQAAAVAQGKGGVTEKVNEAAAAVATFVEAEGLASVEATDLSAVIARIAATRSAKQRPRGAGSGGGPDAPPRLEEWAASSTTSSTDTASSGSSGGSSGGTGLPAIAQEAMPLAWKALASAAGKLVDEVYRPVAFVENTESDTQAWVYVSEELREVVVAFRGTEQIKWKDLISDLNLIPTSFDTERTGAVDLGLGALPLPFAKFKRGKELMVHSGFLAAYDSIKAKLRRIVDLLTRDRSAEQPWTVFLTGHSLGGALATLAAYEQAGRRGPGAAGIIPVMYTFGAPRVGNKAFAEEFNSRMQGRSWRITNTSDIVPSVPRLMGYAHVASGVRLDASGRLVFEASRDVLGEGREVAEVITDLASQALEVAQGARALEDVIDAIRDQEMEILNALVDGSALGQHMEDFYLATLKEAVLAANPALAGRVQQALESAAAAAASTAAGADAADAGKA